MSSLTERIYEWNKDTIISRITACCHLAPIKAGGKLNASVENEKVKITDAKVNSAYVTAADLNASNGVNHVIDSVLLPK